MCVCVCVCNVYTNSMKLAHQVYKLSDLLLPYTKWVFNQCAKLISGSVTPVSSKRNYKGVEGKNKGKSNLYYISEE